MGKLQRILISFLIVLDAGNSKIKVPAPREGPLTASSGGKEHCILTGQKTEGKRGRTPFIKPVILVYSWELCQKTKSPHLPKLWCWGLSSNLWILREHKHSNDSKRGYFHTLSSVILIYFWHLPSKSGHYTTLTWCWRAPPHFTWLSCTDRNGPKATGRSPRHLRGWPRLTIILRRPLLTQMLGKHCNGFCHNFSTWNNWGILFTHCKSSLSL